MSPIVQQLKRDCIGIMHAQQLDADMQKDLTDMFNLITETSVQRSEDYWSSVALARPEVIKGVSLVEEADKMKKVMA